MSATQTAFSALKAAFSKNSNKPYIEQDRVTGVVTHEIYGNGTLPHREDGPALIERDPTTGAVTLEAWFKDGQYERADGPAYIAYDAKTGAVTHEAWYRYGKQIEPMTPGQKAPIYKSPVVGGGVATVPCPQP